MRLRQEIAWIRRYAKKFLPLTPEISVIDSPKSTVASRHTSLHASKTPPLLYIKYEKFRCDLISVKMGDRKLITPNFFATELFTHRKFSSLQISVKFPFFCPAIQKLVIDAILT